MAQLVERSAEEERTAQAQSPATAPPTTTFVANVADRCKDVVVACKERLQLALSSTSTSSVSAPSLEEVDAQALSSALSSLKLVCGDKAAPFSKDERAPLEDEVASFARCVLELPGLLKALREAHAVPGSHSQGQGQGSGISHLSASVKRALIAQRTQLVNLAKGVVGLAQDLELAKEKDLIAINLNTPRNSPNSGTDIRSEAKEEEEEEEEEALEEERREAALLSAALQRKAVRGTLRKSQTRQVRHLLEELLPHAQSQPRAQVHHARSDLAELRTRALAALDFEESDTSEQQEPQPQPQPPPSQQDEGKGEGGQAMEDKDATAPVPASSLSSSSSLASMRAHAASQHDASQRLVSLVRSLFEAEWSQLPPERQAQLKRDVQLVLATVAPAPAPATSFESQRRNTLTSTSVSASPGSEMSGLGLASTTGEGGKGALSALIGKSNKNLRSKEGKEGKEGKRVRSVDKGGGSVKRVGAGRGGKVELKRLALSSHSQTPRTATVLKMQSLALQIVAELSAFVTEHATADLRVSAIEALDKAAPTSTTSSSNSSSASPSVGLGGARRDRRAALYALVNQVLGLLRLLVLSRPASVRELELSAPESGTVRAVQRVETELRKEAQGSIRALDEELVAEACQLLWHKRALLSSLTRSGQSVAPLLEQLLTALLSSSSLTSSQPTTTSSNDDERSSFLVTLALAGRVAATLREVLDDLETYTYLTLFEQSTYLTKRAMLKEKRKEREKADKEASRKDKDSKDKDKPWWDEAKRLAALPVDKYRAATLSELLVRLTSEGQGQEFRTAFFLGYRSFTSSARELWEKLSDLCHVPKGVVDEGEARARKQRVAETLLYWVQTDARALDAQLLSEMKALAEKLLAKDSLLDSARSLLAELAHVDTLFALPALPSPLRVPSELALFEWPASVPSYAQLALFDAEEIADELSALSALAYAAIDPSELVALRWSKPKHSLLARNVLAYAQSVERVSFWAATFVLAPVKLKERVKALAHVIAVAKELELRRNFSALMGVLNGLSLNSVARLRATWDALPRKQHELYDALAAYQNPSGSFKCLRDAMKGGDAHTLPYLGIFLQDLTSLDENVEFVAAPSTDQPPLVNFAKHVLISNSITACLQYQEHARTVSAHTKPREPLHSLLSELPHLNATELYYISLEREARVQTQSTA